MIDVNKNLRIAKITKKEEKLKLTNELKLITAPDDVYKLWAGAGSKLSRSGVIANGIWTEFRQMAK